MPVTDRFDVAVAGAGLAGLTCAMELATAGLKVVVLEARSVVGGRTSSWTDPDGMQVESGLHRVLGVYEALPDQLQRAGINIDDIVTWQDEVEFRSAPPAPSAVLNASLVHRPLQTVAEVLGHNEYLPPVVKASAAKVLAAGLRDYALAPEQLDAVTILAYARKHDAHPLVIDRVLQPLTSGIFFIPAERYSAYDFFGLIAPYADRALKLSVGAFRGGMTEVMTGPMAAALSRRGAQVRTSAGVSELEVQNGEVTGVRIDGGVITAGHVVLATPLDAAQRLVRQHWSAHPFFSGMLALRTMPAATLQLELDGPSMPVDHTTFGVHTHLACFSEQSRTTFRGVPGRLSVILSPAEKFLTMTPEQALAHALDDADRLNLRVRGHVRRYRAVNHPADFYALEPRQDRLRPAQETPVRGLTLAGDYTRQQYLATMEGAVVSGRLAAAAVGRAYRQ